MGTYRLRVDTADNTTWHIEFSQDVFRTFVVDIDPQTGGLSSAHGVGSQLTVPFQVTVPPPAGSSPNVGGSVYAEQHMTFFLVAVDGASHHRYLMLATRGGEGGWGGRLPRSGTYRLQVTGTGPWQFDIAQP
jgi:hypothetical protein